MATFPHLTDWSAISSRPFSKYAASIEAMGTAKFPLHIGDTHLPPPQSAMLTSLCHDTHKGLHKYCSPKGVPGLVSAISKEYEVSPNRVMIVPGATGGLHISAMATLSPGDEVLVLAPFWPLAAGIIRAVGGVPVPVPYFGTIGTAMERLQPYITKKTVAVYCNTPNNPSGTMLTSDETEEIANIAVSNGWWIYADEVYERLIYDGEHTPLRRFAPKNTISLFSFSKAYAMAGYRCGYVILPDKSMEDTFLKGMVHSFYSVPTAAQVMAIQVLKNESEWLTDTKSIYHQAGTQMAEILGQPTPTNGTFIFMDIAEYLQGRSFDDFMEACIAEKMLLAPGSAFGKGYETHIRICFTSAAPEVVVEGAMILKQILRG